MESFTEKHGISEVALEHWGTILDTENKVEMGGMEEIPDRTRVQTIRDWKQEYRPFPEKQARISLRSLREYKWSNLR